MRILYWHEHPTAPGQGGGGAESLLRDEIAALKAFGHSTAWLSTGHIEQAVEQFRPDIVHASTLHNYLPNWREGMRWLQASGIPHVWALMDYWPFCGGRMCLDGAGGVSGKGCAAVRGTCDGNCGCGRADPEWAALVNGSPVVALNEHTADLYRRNGLRADYVVELGVDLEMFRPDPARKQCGSILVTSAWPEYPVKGMHVVQDAIAGTGHRVQLISHQPREVVADALKVADLHLFPSIYEETWGLCLNEAMASGCACIASDVAGARAQVHDGLGVLVPPGDAGALREALDWLTQDHETRETLGQLAREHVAAEHSLAAMGRRWEAVYQAVIGG